MTPAPKAQDLKAQDLNPSSLLVPAVSYESLTWRPRHNPDASKREIARQTGTYNSAMTPLLAQWQPALSTELIIELEDAMATLRNYEQHVLTSLPPNTIALGPLASILLRTESASSSQIEHLTSSAKQLALAELDQGKHNAVLVLANVRAMQAALRLSESLSMESLLEMHSELLAGDPTMTEHAGNLRTQTVWIGGRDSAGPIGSSFVPPTHHRVPSALADLESFIQRDDLPALMHAAVAHAQFETIHPFVDGNGRTGRALVHAMLRGRDVSQSFVLPVSSGILTNLDSYFNALTAFRNGDAEPIVRVFTRATRYAASRGMTLVDQLVRELRESEAKLAGVRRHAKAWDLLPALLGQPVINTEFVKAHLGINDAAAARALATLTDRGVLHETTGNSRNRIWQHNGVLATLDAYAEQIRRDSK